MGKLIVEDPATGEKIRLDWDDGRLPTQEELESVFSALNRNVDAKMAEHSVDQQIRDAAQVLDTGGAGDEIAGALETAGALLSGAAAEPVAGLAGLAQSMNPAAEPGAGAQTVDAVRDALTYEPRSGPGQRNLATLAEPIQAVADFFDDVGLTPKHLGEQIMGVTGSPVLATIAEAIPHAVLELGVLKGTGNRLRKTQQAADARLLEQGAPAIEELFEVGRAVFNEIDALGANVKAEAALKLVGDLRKAAKQAGARPRTTPGVEGLLTDFEDLVTSDTVLSLDELNQFRTAASNLAQSTEPALRAPAVAMIDAMDDFLDAEGASILDAAAGVNVGKRYQAARKLWGRARKAQLLEEMHDAAELQASGLENGLRIKYRQLLNNKKQRRYFNKPELDAMRAFVKGDKPTNFMKLLGRLGFSEGSATHILGAAAGAGAGAYALGPAGAVAVPLIGQTARKAAQAMTAGKERYIKALTLAGKDGRKIVQAYKLNTPKGERSADQLANLLLDTDIDLAKVGEDALAIEAANLAAQRRAQLAAVAAMETPPNQEEKTP